MLMPACDRGDDKFVQSRDNIEPNSRVCTTAGDAKRHTDELKVVLCGALPISSDTSPGGLHANSIDRRKGFQLSHIFVETLRRGSL